MRFITNPFRHADVILETPGFVNDRDELFSVLASVSDDEIIERFESQYQRAKSISAAINSLVKERLVTKGWLAEAPIFQHEDYTGNRWRLDFAKGKISVEMAFNHGEAIAWNLLKPVLASELNHVQKAIQTEVGVIICATGAMKAAGGFDSAVGDYEKFSTYLRPLQSVLTVPVLLIGLDAPESFDIELRRDGRHNIGYVRPKY